MAARAATPRHARDVCLLALHLLRRPQLDAQYPATHTFLPQRMVIQAHIQSVASCTALILSRSTLSNLLSPGGNGMNETHRHRLECSSIAIWHGVALHPCSVAERCMHSAVEIECEKSEDETVKRDGRASFCFIISVSFHLSGLQPIVRFAHP